MEICDKFLCVNRKNKECHVPKNVVAFTCKHTNAPCPKARCEYCSVKCGKNCDWRIDRMSMISEQVKELRELSEIFEGKRLGRVLGQAADTIEALSAKLQAANEELERWHTDKVNEKIKNPFAQKSTIICHNCDHKDDYIEELEAENIKRLDSCIWILCEQGTLPDKEVLCCDNHGEMILGYIVEDEISETGFSAESEHEYMYNCVKWMEKPKP